MTWRIVHVLKILNINFISQCTSICCAVWRNARTSHFDTFFISSSRTLEKECGGQWIWVAIELNRWTMKDIWRVQNHNEMPYSFRKWWARWGKIGVSFGQFWTARRTDSNELHFVRGIHHRNEQHGLVLGIVSYLRNHAT